MTEATKAIKSLKRAANYTKLAMRELGPRSFKKGQGALLKATYKFGEDGAIGKSALKQVLGWKGCDVRKVAEKARHNGYVDVVDEDMEFRVVLTEKGTEVIRKRLEAESRAADAVMAGLSDEERATLVELTDRISRACEELGVDYSRIEKREGRCGCRGRRAGRKGRGCRGHHGHGHGGCRGGRGQGAPRYVFVFENGEGGCRGLGEGHGHHHGCRCHDERDEGGDGGRGRSCHKGRAKGGKPKGGHGKRHGRS